MSETPKGPNLTSVHATARTRRRRSRAQASVELALSVPLLLMMFLVVVETGRAFYIAISLSNAARAGVQYGSQNLTTAGDTVGMQAAATNDAPNLVGMTAVATHFCVCANGSASTCLSTDCAGSHRLLYTEVTTSASYSPLISFMGILPPMTVPGKAIMRVVQ
jgi:Flp pilus assembly protein TadG